MLKALDLFSCAGGAAMGLHLAGYTVMGMDIVPQPNYPFEHKVQDITELVPEDLQEYDLVWASPPCQAHSIASARWRNEGYEYPDHIAFTRDLLINSGVPYIMENVEGAPMNNPIKLCGTMFDCLKVFRHRLFETSFPVDMSEMKCKHKGHKAKERRTDNGDYFTVAGHNTGTLAEWEDAMGIDWMSKKELAQAIPPEYSYWLAKQLQKLT